MLTANGQQISSTPPRSANDKIEFTSLLSTRKCQLIIIGVVFFLVSLGVILGLLIPQQPTFIIDRNASVRELRLKPSTDNTTLGTLYGNITAEITNHNIYDYNIISLASGGIIGPASNSISFKTTVNNLYLPASATTRAKMYISQVIPSTVDVPELTKWVILECARNGGEMNILVGFDATVQALGQTITVGQPIQSMKSPCLQ
jgi:hypothetical protein